MILTTSRLRLRPWQPGDEAALVKYAGNRNVSRYMRDRFPYPYTETDARNWISIASQDSPTAHFAIEYLGEGGAPGEAIGSIGLMLGEDVYHRSAELGYWIGEPFWGRGIILDAIGVIVPYGFQTFSLTRIFAAVFENNPRSARVLERAGFALEGRLLKSVVKDHVVMDSLLYAVVR
jgi:RimJ/RimL family protein N-acetyltransferase